MTTRHEQKIILKQDFIPLLRELSVDLGDLIKFSVQGGEAWVLIPGSAIVVARDSERGSAACLDDDGKTPCFSAFVVTERTPVMVRVVGRAENDAERVLSYSVLCDPDGEGRAYYAQGASPPRIKLPPPKS